MNKISAGFRTRLLAAQTAFREKLAFRANFAASMLTYGLFVFVFSRIWASALSGEASIAGYDYRMMVWYFIIAEIPLFSLGNFFWNLSRDMKSGQVAYLLSRPFDFVSYQYWERLGSAMPGFLLLLGEGLVIGLLITGSLPPSAASAAVLGGEVFAPSGQIIRATLVLVSLLLSATLSFYLQFALALTAFWLEENEAFYWIFQKLALVVGTLLPVEFLPARVLSLALWTPFPYIAYAPARIFVAFDGGTASRLLGIQALWIGLGILATRLVFGFGVRKISVNGG